VPVDVAAIGADFLCGACHKWMMAGYGLAAFFARADWLESCPPPQAGWTSVEPDALWDTLGGARVEETPHALVAHGADHGARLRRDAAALEAGGGAWSLYPALDAALDLHEAVDVGVTRTHVLALQRALREGLRARGFRPNAPDAPELGSGICVFPVEGDPARAVRALAEERIVVTARGGGVRVSTHVFNDASDVDAALGAVDRLGVRPA
jgi:selenocysteine lyase/cysteine desulfurase